MRRLGYVQWAICEVKVVSCEAARSSKRLHVEEAAVLASLPARGMWGYTGVWTVGGTMSRGRDKHIPYDTIEEQG